MKRTILKDEELHKRIMQGTKILRDIVCCTMGANGSNVIIEPTKAKEFHRVTKDGVSVANSVFLEDGYANMGVSMIVDAAISTVNKIGDGTTTTTLLSSTLYESAFDEEGKRLYKINRFKKQIKEEQAFISSKLESLRKEAESREVFESVATLSANNDREIGKLVADVFEKVGSESSIRISISDGEQTSFVIEKGFSLPFGYIHKFFVDNQVEKEIKNCCVSVFTHEMNSLEDIEGYANMVSQSLGSNIYVIFAKSFSNEFLSSCMETKNTMGFNIIPIEIKVTDGYPEDIASICGCHYVDSIQTPILSGSEHISRISKVDEMLISSRKTIIRKERGNEEEEMFQKHIEEVLTLKENMETKTMKEKISQRINKLKGKIAHIKVGGDTESEKSYMYDMLDDSVKATDSAIKEGYVLGCGVTYLYLSDLLNEHFENSILANVLQNPIKTLCQNSDFSEEETNQIIENIRKSQYKEGFDIFEDSIKMVNLEEKGVVEPFGLIVSCIENSISVANLLISSRGGIGVSKN